MVEVHKKLSRHSTLIACMAGLVLSLTLLALASAGLIYEMVQEARREQDRNSALIASIGKQSKALLVQLKEQFKPECTPQNLAALNGLLFEYRFHKDIGLYNSDGLLYCTSAMGLLPHPLADTPTPYIHKLGGPIWFNELAPVSQGKVRTTIMSSKPFSLVIDPGVIIDIFNNADVVWFGSVATPSRFGARVPTALQAPILALYQSKREGWHILWSAGIVVSVVQAEGTMLRFANFRYLSDAYTEQPLIAGSLLFFALLSGIATGVLLKPRLLRMASLRYRLPGLLNAQHVLCMYQPIVELATGRPVGCEVLMRMQDGGAMVYPDEIIPAAYQQGLTWQLDRAVIALAMSELAALLPRIRGFKVAFNLFPESVSYAPVDAIIRPYLAECAAHDVRIGLELTEYHFSESIIPELRLFEQGGYQMSVDDFGTGYSNLNTVKKVAPHTLKIDKSFVFEMEDASVRSSLIPEIVGIAKAVNATVVAEGIENAAQAERLQTMGVSYGQGYHFARPMLLGDFVAYVSAFSKKEH